MYNTRTHVYVGALRAPKSTHAVYDIFIILLRRYYRYHYYYYSVVRVQVYSVDFTVLSIVSITPARARDVYVCVCVFSSGKPYYTYVRTRSNDNNSFELLHAAVKDVIIS